MRALVQRVNHASVTNVDEQFLAADPEAASSCNSIGKGFVILLGVGQDDDKQKADKLWSKISKLRIFEDESGKPISLLRTLMARSYWLASSPCMRTARRATALVSPKRLPPMLRMICMSILQA